MLFLQGSKAVLAEFDLVQQTVAGLNDQATLELIADADHAFHVPANTGRKDPEVLAMALARAVGWMMACASTPLSEGQELLDQLSKRRR
jgi:hypothetical protein